MKTGTFGQYRALVPSVENGYFSRLLTVVIPSTNGFDKRYVSSNADETDGDKDRPNLVDTIYCSDQDYEAAEMIGGKLILHAAMAYKMIEGEKTELVLKLNHGSYKKVG